MRGSMYADERAMSNLRNANLRKGNLRKMDAKLGKLQNAECETAV